MRAKLSKFILKFLFWAHFFGTIANMLWALSQKGTTKTSINFERVEGKEGGHKRFTLVFTLKRGSKNAFEANLAILYHVFCIFWASQFFMGGSQKKCGNFLPLAHNFLSWTMFKSTVSNKTKNTHAYCIKTTSH